MNFDFNYLQVPEKIRDDTIAVTDWLYSNCYIRQFGVKATPCQDDPGLIAALRKANASQDVIDHGWKVVELLPDGGLLARKRGAIRRFEPGEYAAADRGPGSRPEIGDTATVFGRRESLITQIGMYFIFSQAVAPIEEDTGLLRFYWNVLPPHVPALVEQLTSVLNAFAVPFRFKCPANADAYPRRDAGVLYVNRLYSHLTLPLIARIHHGLQLEPSVPLFTRQLAPGLGFAEDPGKGESFGMHRCRIVAEAMIAGEPLESLFERAGLSLTRPYLNAGSTDIDWPPIVVSPIGPRPTPSSFLDTAARIGARLCRSAIWHNTMCNWTSDTIHGDGIIHAALDPKLYSGSSGVSWFLARLADATGEPLFADTAAAALRNAQSRPATGNGLYTGSTGIGFVAGAIQPAACEAGLYDLLGGAAGQIAGLLAMHPQQPHLLQRAIDHGDWLLANRNPRTSAWPMPASATELSGFSHGAAGIGWALAELAAVTREPRFAEAARDAFRFERASFNPVEQKWPDLRPDDEVHYPVHWCHGAPGIALSRLRAATLLDFDTTEIAIELEAALTATAESIDYDGNWCLCHGNCGNADILLTAGRPQIAERLGEEGIERIERRGLAWPCVSNMEEPAGLMTGVAGIGYFYLRLHHPASTPSILLIR